jgi:hypothetical protein
MQFRYKKIDYTIPASAAGGPGTVAQIPWYVSPYIDMTAAQFKGLSQDIGASIGDIFWLGGKAPASGGNAFMFVKATAALAFGQVLTLAAPTAGTYTAAGSTSAKIITNISNVTAGVNGEVDNFINVNAAGGSTKWNTRRIKANDASATGSFTVALPDFLRPNSPLDQDIFAGFADFANADAVQVIRPYYAAVAGVGSVPNAISLGIVTSGNYTIVQVAGLAGVLSTSATANVPAIPGAAGVIVTAAGVGNGTGGAAAAALGSTGGMILPMLTNAVAANIVPCMVNFIGT